MQLLGDLPALFLVEIGLLEDFAAFGRQFLDVPVDLVEHVLVGRLLDVLLQEVDLGQLQLGGVLVLEPVCADQVFQPVLAGVQHAAVEEIADLVGRDEDLLLPPHRDVDVVDDVCGLLPRNELAGIPGQFIDMPSVDPIENDLLGIGVGFVRIMGLMGPHFSSRNPVKGIKIMVKIGK